MTNKTAAARYARALLDVSLKEAPLQNVQTAQQIERDLAEFIDLMHQHADLDQVMLNPAVPAPRKHALMGELLKRVLISPVLGKLMLLLAGRDRLVLLPDLLASYRERLMAHLKVVQADVTTAVELPADRAQAIERSLVRLSGMQVALTTHIDPAIVGGLVARIGSTVYNGSVTRQLERMKQRLVDHA